MDEMAEQQKTDRDVAAELNTQLRDIMLAVSKPEGSKGTLTVKGAMKSYWFDKKALEEYREGVKQIITMMPDCFQAGFGRGDTMMKLINTRTNHTWGTHADCDALVSLGIALGYAKHMGQRDQWKTLPGKLPYVLFDTTE